jgi:predicted HD phosphohydrolase
MDEAFPEDLHLAGSPRAQHTLLVAALLHLMSHYTANGGRAGSRDGPCIDLATVIERHLDALAHLPDADPVLRATCEQLSVKWATRVDRAVPAPPRRSLLARILRPGPRRTCRMAG